MKNKLCSVLLCLSVILSAMLSFSGCGSSDDGYYIYEIASNGVDMREEKYDGERPEDKVEFARSLIDRLGDDEDRRNAYSPIPKDVDVKDIVFSEDGTRISLYFTPEYSKIAFTREPLVRAAIVKTMLQVEDVNSLAFYVGSDPLVDALGRTVGLMTKDSFIGDFGKNQAALQIRDLLLYYPSETGDSLVPYGRRVHYSSNTNLAKLVIENLCIEPVGSGLKALLKDSSAFLHISVNDGICYIDLDSTYFTKVTGVTQDVAIYALVNSLCELDGISKVQITVYSNGTPDISEKSLSGTYEKNTSLIKD